MKQKAFPVVFWRGCSIKASNVSKVHLRASPTLQVRSISCTRARRASTGKTQKLLMFLRAQISERYQVPHNHQLTEAYNSSIKQMSCYGWRS